MIIQCNYHSFPYVSFTELIALINQSFRNIADQYIVCVTWYFFWQPALRTSYHELTNSNQDIDSPWCPYFSYYQWINKQYANMSLCWLVLKWKNTVVATNSGENGLNSLRLKDEIFTVSQRSQVYMVIWSGFSKRVEHILEKTLFNDFHAAGNRSHR